MIVLKLGLIYVFNSTYAGEIMLSTSSFGLVCVLSMQSATLFLSSLHFFSVFGLSLLWWSVSNSGLVTLLNKRVTFDILFVSK